VRRCVSEELTSWFFGRCEPGAIALGWDEGVEGKALRPSALRFGERQYSRRTRVIVSASTHGRNLACLPLNVRTILNAAAATDPCSYCALYSPHKAKSLLRRG
jgi:hypothetical protein